MEIVAMDMKLRGMYIARQLSFTGVTFKIEEVPLSQRYIDMYNKSVRLVRADPPPPPPPFESFLSGNDSQPCLWCSGCTRGRGSSRPPASWMRSSG